MVHPLIRPAITSKPHDFIHLYFRNYKPDHSHIAQLYQSGLSLREIQIKTGVSKASVRRSLIKSGVRIRGYSKELNKQSGLHTNKPRLKPPFGFWFLEGQITKHPKEYPVLLQIIKRWKSGQSLNSISDILNRQQIRSPRGKKWSWNSIATIIERIKEGILIQKGEDYELR